MNPPDETLGLRSDRSGRGVAILGATGSIGASTLDLLASAPDRFTLVGATGHRNDTAMAELCHRFAPRVVAMADPEAAARLAQRLSGMGSPPEILSGPSGVTAVAEFDGVDLVVAAIVGAAGLPATLAAARAGRCILLANKEALVMAGSLFLDAAQACNAQLLPIDSEHNAIFQCLAGRAEAGEPFLAGRTKLPADVRRLLLTGSGGPFRRLDLDAFAGVTPDQACRHPNWDMGRKISVDSATMMNKGLELIEACLLFGAGPERIEVVIHPQSIVHSMVEYVDGSVLAQLGQPDMRTPIAHALAWPERMASPVTPLDFTTLGDLTFEAPDAKRFPALTLARAAADAGGLAPVWLNAVNEVAVQAFLEERLSFPGVTAIIAAVMEADAGHWARPAAALEDVLEADAMARAHATQLIAVSVSK